MRFVLLLLAVSGCPYSQSTNCGEEYTRNMTHVKSGLYRVEGDSVAGSQQLRLEIVSGSVVVTTADGRSARYRVQ